MQNPLKSVKIKPNNKNDNDTVDTTILKYPANGYQK